MDSLNDKISKNIGITNKLRYYLDLYVLKQLYYSLIYPHLQYGIISWGNAYKSHLKKIITKQNKCIRSIVFPHSRESAMPYYNLFNLLTFENMYKFKAAIFGHRLIANEPNVSSVFLEYLTPISEIHGHYTRYSSQRNLYRDLKHKPIMAKKRFNFLFQKYGKLYLVNLKV